MKQLRGTVIDSKVSLFEIFTKLINSNVTILNAESMKVMTLEQYFHRFSVQRIRIFSNTNVFDACQHWFVGFECRFDLQHDIRYSLSSSIHFFGTRNSYKRLLILHCPNHHVPFEISSLGIGTFRSVLLVCNELL